MKPKPIKAFKVLVIVNIFTASVSGSIHTLTNRKKKWRNLGNMLIVSQSHKIELVITTLLLVLTDFWFIIVSQ